MKIAVIGASGKIGSQIVAEALSRGHEVTGIARHPEKIVDRPGLTRQHGDIGGGEALSGVLRGHDAIVSAVRFKDFDPVALIEAVKASGVNRLLMVGGAGSLEVRPGVALLDTPEFPGANREEAVAGRLALETLRRAPELAWTFLCPSAVIGPGDRTGQFRLGGDQLLVGTDG
jgi:putative NADH-flavin reductase